jgi:putative oxidoreductase
LQRLFSAFPNALPGVGLLLLRASLIIPIVIMGCDRRIVLHSLGQVMQQLFALGMAGCLALGFATPLAAGLQAAVSLWVGYVESDSAWLYWSLAGVCASLMMIGPGAWSIDAWIFGRKRIDVAIRKSADRKESPVDDRPV